MSDQPKFDLTLGPSQDERAVFATLEQSHEYTLERIREVRPELIPMVGALFFEHRFSIAEIARGTAASINTVRRIILAAPAGVDAEGKRSFGNACMLTATELLNQIQTRLNTAGLEEEKLRDIATTLGILVDKAQLLSGGPTARVALETDQPGIADLLAEIGFQEEKPGQTREAEYRPIDPPGPESAPAPAPALPAHAITD